MLAGFKSYLNITSVTKFMFSRYFSGYNELLSFLPQTEQTVTFHRRLASESQAGGTLLRRLVFILGGKKKPNNPVLVVMVEINTAANI